MKKLVTIVFAITFSMLGTLNSFGYDHPVENHGQRLVTQVRLPFTLESAIDGIHMEIIRLNGYSTLDERKQYLLPIEKLCLKLKSLQMRGPSYTVYLTKVDEFLTALDSAYEYFDISYERENIQGILINIDLYKEQIYLLRGN